jgi:hypothetical protein
VIMVDELRVHPNAKGIFKKGSCHLTTDGPLDELHLFAARLGMKRSWFQDHPSAPHYDLVESRRKRALTLGAVFVSARDQAIARVAKRGSSGQAEGG